MDQLALRFQVLGAIGQGAHAVVYRATDGASGAPRAVKVVRTSDEELKACVRREYDILSSLDHRCIIKARGILNLDHAVAIAMDYFPGQTLQSAVTSSAERRLDSAVALAVLTNLAEAVAYLHSRCIVHRDIKSDNVLVAQDLSELRLVDFGVAHRELVDGEMLEMHGSHPFMAPEVLAGESIDRSCDVWGTGLCLYLMLFGRLPASRDVSSCGEAPESGVWWWRSARKGSAPGCAPYFEDVLASCLHRDSGRRVTAEELLKRCLAA